MREFLIEHWSELLHLMREHLWLVFLSTMIAVLIGLPVGILLSRYARLRAPVLAVANIMQTVPSLALFGLLIPLPFIGGIGARTAIVALVLYALLPVIRNTVTGILGVNPAVREAALAMGMTNGQILWQVELPLAMSVILTGVRVATVICVGVATIAAAIGAGGLGTYIFRGLRQNDNDLILAGAIPAALMALAFDFILGLLERHFDYERKRSRPVQETERQARLRRLAWVAPLLLLALISGAYFIRERNISSSQKSNRQRVRIGSKDYTESIILAEIVAQLLEARGVEVERQFELGGNLPHDALVSNRIDLYPEYTGTSFAAIFHHKAISDPRAVYEQVKREYLERFDVEVSEPIGFEDTFAMLIRGSEARRLNIKTLTDAVPHARNWQAGFGQDFMSRDDGYRGLVRAYNLQFARPPREMDLSLTYRALASGKVDLIAGNSTDGLISELDLVQLEDDKHFFPPYEAVYVTRRETLQSVPSLRETLQRLRNSITTEEMRRLNYEVDGRQRPYREVVREWIKSKGVG